MEKLNLSAGSNQLNPYEMDDTCKNPPVDAACTGIDTTDTTQINQDASGQKAQQDSDFYKALAVMLSGKKSNTTNKGKVLDSQLIAGAAIAAVAGASVMTAGSTIGLGVVGAALGTSSGFLAGFKAGSGFSASYLAKELRKKGETVEEREIRIKAEIQDMAGGLHAEVQAEQIEIEDDMVNISGVRVEINQRNR